MEEEKGGGWLKTSRKSDTTFNKNFTWLILWSIYVDVLCDFNIKWTEIPSAHKSTRLPGVIDLTYSVCTEMSIFHSNSQILDQKNNKTYTEIFIWNVMIERVWNQGLLCWQNIVLYINNDLNSCDAQKSFISWFDKFSGGRRIVTETVWYSDWKNCANWISGALLPPPFKNEFSKLLNSVQNEFVPVLLRHTLRVLFHLKPANTFFGYHNALLQIPYEVEKNHMKRKKAEFACLKIACGCWLLHNLLF